MWTVRRKDLTNGRGKQFIVERESRLASYAEVLDGWRDHAGFRKQFNSWLAEEQYIAFRWETPAVTASSLSQPFEFILLDSPELERRPDSHAFAEHFEQSESDIAVFRNLGGDAIMIVPCPVAQAAAYGHLAAFVRLAPEPQRDALWRAIGTAMRHRVADKPVWLSTAGAGVSWLHVRLDDRPKYYGFRPYAQLPQRP